MIFNGQIDQVQFPEFITNLFLDIRQPVISVMYLIDAVRLISSRVNDFVLVIQARHD
jgi:hypothetical protein